MAAHSSPRTTKLYDWRKSWPEVSPTFRVSYRKPELVA